ERQGVAHCRDYVVDLVCAVARGELGQVCDESVLAELRRLERPDHDHVELAAARCDVTRRDLAEGSLVEHRVVHLDAALLGEERRRELRDVLHLGVVDHRDVDRAARPAAAAVVVAPAARHPQPDEQGCDQRGADSTSHVSSFEKSRATEITRCKSPYSVGLCWMSRLYLQSSKIKPPLAL